MPATYRYLFCDLLTDQRITELDLQPGPFDRRIIEPGSWSASYTITSSEAAERVQQLTEGRTIVHILRGGELWGSYLVWTMTPRLDQRGGLTVDMQGATLESAFDHGILDVDLDFEGTDQLEIARALVADFQYYDARNLGILVDDSLSGVYRDRHYPASGTDSYGKLLANLANVDNGFEWMVRTFIAPSTGDRLRQYISGYPTLGQAGTTHVFTYPGNVLSWQETRDATQGGTRFWTRGDSPEQDLTDEAEPLLSNKYRAQPLLDRGWPLWDVVEDHQGVTELDTLNAYARRLLASRAGSIRIFELTVRLDDNTSFSPNQLGDDARVILHDLWHPLDRLGAPMFNRRARIVGCQITPPSRSQGQETAKLILESKTDLI